MYNKQSLTSLAGTLCAAMGIEAPRDSRPICNGLYDYIMFETNGAGVDRIVMYNPDAIAQWLYFRYYDLFDKIRGNTGYEQRFRTVYPSITPVCFATMYSGVSPRKHGIRTSEKPPLGVDTVFDAMLRAGKRPCIAAVKGCSMSLIFRDRDMDILIGDSDGEVTDLGLNAIASGKYDMVCIYNCEHDDVMHGTYPTSPEAMSAIVHYNDAFGRIAECVRDSFAGRTLLGCATDHGTHVDSKGRGSHGSLYPADMNIVNWYGVISSD